MGSYMTMTQSNFNVLAENMSKALELIKNLAMKNDHLCVDYDDVLNADSLSEALDAFSYQTEEDGEGSIVAIEFTGEKLFEDYVMFSTLAPVVENGSFIEMSGEDWNSWRWVFEDGKCEKIEPTIIWKNDKKKAEMEQCIENLTKDELIRELEQYGVANFNKQILLVWSIKDVQGVRPDLTDEQAIEVLKRVRAKHDMVIGVNWDTLATWVDELYPHPLVAEQEERRSE